MKVEKKLKGMGHELPLPPDSVASYVNFKHTGNLIFISGQGPNINGEQKYVGKVGGELTQEQGYEAAKLCGLNLLAQLKKCLGDLDLVKEVVHVKGFVASTEDFYNQPFVMNGASDLITEAFGQKGKHTRCALGTNVLPGNIPVEVEMIVEIK